MKTPGIRKFDCGICGYLWEEKSIDCKSGSQSQCAFCGGNQDPVGHEERPEWRIMIEELKTTAKGGEDYL